jgi:formylmethanofuran dehydrogenase subunit E
MSVRAVTNQHFNAQAREQNLDHKTMVKCSKCQLYILEREATIYEGKPYCSQDHAREPSK